MPHNQLTHLLNSYPLSVANVIRSVAAKYAKGGTTMRDRVRLGEQLAPTFTDTAGNIHRGQLDAAILCIDELARQ